MAEQDSSELIRKILMTPDQDLRAMRLVANGHQPSDPLGKLYAGLFKDDPKEFSRQKRSAEKDYRAELLRAQERGEQSTGAAAGSDGPLPDEASDRIEELIQKLLQEACGHEDDVRAEGAGGA